MSAVPSINAAFTLALASQAEGVAARLDARPGDIASPKPDAAALLATIDPTRAAFASALQGLDIANAPQVAGPYVPGGVSGPLTEDDIFDPSMLYSLPGQELVVFAGTGARPSATPAPPSVATPSSLAASTTGATIAYDDEVEASHPAGAEGRQTLGLSTPQSKLSVDIGTASIEVRPSTLSLEFAIAGYMSLLKVGLGPAKRKLLRRLKSRDAPCHDDRARLVADEADHEDTGRVEDGMRR